MKDAAILEAEAIRSAMLKALEEGWTSLLIHSDCKCLVSKINHRCFGLSLLDVLIDDTYILVDPFGDVPSYLLEGNTIALVMV